jgi:type III pantothenate kinase
MCLDVGNTQIHGGIYEGDELKFQFRQNTSTGLSSDEIGVFLRAVLRENDIIPENISNIAVCSVVPHMDYSLKSACIKYFTEDVMFVRPGLKTGLRIKYLNPQEVGADRIVNAVAAKNLYPNKNILVVDFGTATTLDAISKNGDYLGGAILGGAKLMVSALESKTARLPSVEIKKPKQACGVTTVESIQSGLYWSTFGGVKELIHQITKEKFSDEPPVVIGTGGLGQLFRDANLFEVYTPDLVLKGLYDLHKKNT